jgi:hypothetical protein
MPSEIKRKKTFGTITVDHFSPELGDGQPRAINIHLSFEEALKLHLGLTQILGHLNGYNRSTNPHPRPLSQRERGEGGGREPVLVPRRQAHHDQRRPGAGRGVT